MSKTTTSVALCTYNGEKYLQEQLDSILSQTIPVDEIVICDDCSTDGTLKILEDYKILFPHLFRVFSNEKNLGYVNNFEKALLLCNNDVIFLSDQDDIWKINKVEKTLQFLVENPTISVVAHDLEMMGNFKGDESFWDLKKFPKMMRDEDADNLLSYILIDGNVFPGMSIAIHSTTLQNYLPLQKIDSIIIHDYEIIIKALRDKKFGLIKEKLSRYRQHEEQSIGFREKENTSNAIEEFHLLSQQYVRIQKYTALFSLNNDTIQYFQINLQKKYSLFLKQFSFPKRIFIYFKNKYYLKIIRF